MTPNKFIVYILRVKTRLMKAMYASLTILLIASNAISDYGSYSEHTLKYIVVACLWIIFTTFWWMMSDNIDRKLRGMLYEQIERESDELSTLIYQKHVYSDSQIVPILKGLVKNYGPDLEKLGEQK